MRRRPLSRRDWLKVVGAAGASTLVNPGRTTEVSTEPPILPLTSTSEVFVPPRGRAFEKLSFDFPEPSVSFAGVRLGFLVFSRENIYGLDLARTVVEPSGDRSITLTCTGFVWAGGQEKTAGHLVARIRDTANGLEWDATVQMDRPIKA